MNANKNSLDNEMAGNSVGARDFPGDKKLGKSPCTSVFFPHMARREPASNRSLARHDESS